MITGHMLVKNEENFIWYSVVSVVDYIDKILIWDTGSTDKTNSIVEELVRKYKNKIDYRKVGKVNETEYTKIRQQMLDVSPSGWIFILDGDEVWWRESILKVTDYIQSEEGKDSESVIVPTINLVGDIYHFQEGAAGRYRFGNKKGHYALRFINRNIVGLHLANEYGKEGFFDNENKPIQDRDSKLIKFLNAPYLHATHIQRSSRDNEVMQRSHKTKKEIGTEFARDFYYPESFFDSRPGIVPNIWNNMNFNFKLIANIETPFRKLKRRIL